MERIVTGMGISEVLKNLRGNDGYYITNTARDRKAPIIKPILLNIANIEKIYED